MIKRASRCCAVIVAAIAVLCGAAFGQGQGGTASELTSQDIVRFLNQSVSWYRDFAVQQQFANEPADVLFLTENSRVRDQVVRLSFDFARAQADLLPKVQAQDATQNQQAAPSTRFAELAAQADAQVTRARAELERLAQRIETATVKEQRSLELAISETQSELELARARRDVMRNMVDFAAGATATGTGSSGLRSQIQELERTVPAARPASQVNQPDSNSRQPSDTQQQNASAAAAPAVMATRRAEPSGIIGLTTDLMALARKLRAIDDAVSATDELAQTSKSLRGPLVGSLKELTQRGDQLASQPDTTDANALRQQKQQIDALTAEFKQRSEAILPLAKQRILLDVYKRSLLNWRSAVKAEYNSDLKSILIRLGVLAFLLALVFSGSALWNKALIRYVHDARRRYQLGLIRRIAVWFVVAIVIAFAFATELGSLATFAGLITAGIALALQNVILSIAGYFFLIGKYGVRVGDRVQVAGVTGQVVDIGLVRLHLMELGSAESAAQPTGRVVVFSNSVVFQPTAGVFKQIPGTNFVWHEIKLTLATDGDYNAIERRLMSAVDEVFTAYRDKMESQRRELEKTISGAATTSLDPQSRLRLTQNGLDVVIRYPVDIDNASAIDDRVTRQLLDAIEDEPKLRLVGSGTPNIQPVQEALAAK